MLMMGEERKLTKTAAKNKEAYAKEFKKGGRMKYFKDKYGKDAEDVVYGTATNMAKRWANPQSFLKRLERNSKKKKNIQRMTLKVLTGLTKKSKKMTPGQVNEVADKYFTEGDSNE